MGIFKQILGFEESTRSFPSIEQAIREIKIDGANMLEERQIHDAMVGIANRVKRLRASRIAIPSELMERIDYFEKSLGLDFKHMAKLDEKKEADIMSAKMHLQQLSETISVAERKAA